MKKYDFSGWATRNDLVCNDGRTIKKDAFKNQNGKTVPLVWGHSHSDPNRVLGHALLENREEGVYAYCSFNDSESGQAAKKLVEHGDVRSLSICAGQLKQAGANVLHGVIYELSLVLAGANPGAFIDSVMAHGDISEDRMIIGYDENIMLYHSADNNDNSEKKKVENNSDEDDETIEEVFNSLTEKQKNVVYALIGQAHEEAGEDEYDDEDEGGNSKMKHNVFEMESENRAGGLLTHEDQESIIKMAKSSPIGTLQTALNIYSEENGLQHAAESSGFIPNGQVNVSSLFSDYQEVRPGEPEYITHDQGWIANVMKKVHKSPISRIRTTQGDIRNIDTIRAKGYKKGEEKKLSGNLKLIRRTTDPQTVYVKSALHRDDIIDITDFDYVEYLYRIDSLMLNEELAMAMMLGDGRDEGDEGKIDPEKIRPIWTDDDLYTIHTDLDIAAAKKELQGTSTGANFGENYIYAEAMINAVLYARETYKGTGTPDMYITPHMLSVMLLARDLNGRRIYDSKSELAAAFNVGDILTVEQFEGKTRKTKENKTKKLLAIIANMNDYSLGATKKGAVTHFSQFDINFNQELSLLETRCSGALTRAYSAIAIEEDVTKLP